MQTWFDRALKTQKFSHTGVKFSGGLRPPLKFAIIQFRVGVPLATQNFAWVLMLLHLHV